MLLVRWRERAQLLNRIDRLLRRDCRVRGAWVSGSTARGDDDALSDLDLYVVVADDAIDDFVCHRKVHAAKPARPILLMDNFANAPIGGAYLLALYEGSAGPQHVDWFWQPESEARRPDDGKIVFDRAGLAIAPGVKRRGEGQRSSGLPLGPNPSRNDLLEHKIAFFWSMSFIAAKYIARRNREAAARMTGVAACTLLEAEALCGDSEVPSDGDSQSPAIRESTTAPEQLIALMRLTKHADALDSQLVAQGVTVPTKAARQINQFFELAEALATRNADLSLLPNKPRRRQGHLDSMMEDR